MPPRIRPGAAVVAALLINLRYLVMGIALNDSLRGGRWWRAVQSQALVDASFVGAHEGGGRFDVARMVGMTVTQWTCWVVGTALGVALHPDPDLLERLGGDVVFPAFFLLLALEEVRSPRAGVALFDSHGPRSWQGRVLPSRHGARDRVAGSSSLP